MLIVSGLVLVLFGLNSTWIAADFFIQRRMDPCEEVAQATASVVSFLFFSISQQDAKKQKTYDRSGRLRDFFAWIDADLFHA